MITLFFSKTELGALSKYWDHYVRLTNHQYRNETEREALDSEAEAALAEVSEESREIFLQSLDDFKLKGTEFTCRIAPDDLKLVS